MGIKIKYKLARFIVVITASLTFANLHSQDIPQKPSRQAALDAFNKGNYEQAYREFGILLENYTRDPLYKYYSGVCLVNLNRQPENALALLQDAVNSPQEIKSVPADAWFYLGRSQQMSGRFAEAIKSFNHFSSESGKKIARGYNVPQYIQECNEGKGQLKVSEIPVADVIEKEVPSVAAESRQETIKSDRPGVKPKVQREAIPEDYDKMLTEGMNYQVKADSLNAVAAGYRRIYGQLPPSQKASYKLRISVTDSLADHYQKLADQKLGINNTVQGTKRVELQEEAAQQIKPVLDNDSALARKNETDKTGAGVLKPVVRKETPEVFSLFEVIKDPALIQNQQTEIDPQLPAGLIYRIQMGVFSKPLPPGLFKGISPLYGFKVASSGMTRYFAGMFRRLDDANKALLTIKQLGFKDSFLVAVSDGAPVSLERAALLEKEWGNKPFNKTVTDPQKNTSTAIPPTLSFRVEVTRSEKPLKEEIIESYRKMAGNRGFDILSTEEGVTVYLIGKFITFESASVYANLLNRNGYREAKVVAYLGNKEIPVETAKQLFEKIE